MPAPRPSRPVTVRRFLRPKRVRPTEFGLRLLTTQAILVRGGEFGPAKGGGITGRVSIFSGRFRQAYLPSSLGAMWLRVLFTGEKATSFPPWLHDRVHADFRKEEEYFVTAFDLILSLYGIAPSDPAVADLRESLHEPRMR